MIRPFLAAAVVPVFSLASANTVEQSPSPPPIQPGQWEFVTEITSVEAPGAREAIVQAMRAQLASQREVQSHCITPEQARDPSRNVLWQSPPGCEFSETNWSGGNIRIRATCSPDTTPRAGAGAGAGAMAVSVEGTYTARQMDNLINLSMEMRSPTEAGAPVQIRFQGRITGRRTADCASQ